MIKEIRKYDTQKIKYMIIQLKSQLLENRFKFSQAELTDTGIFKETRRLIAQLFTILSERKEKLTTADWRVYSEIIAKNESLEIFKKKNKIEEKINEALTEDLEDEKVSVEKPKEKIQKTKTDSKSTKEKNKTSKSSDKQKLLKKKEEKKVIKE